MRNKPRVARSAVGKTPTYRIRLLLLDAADATTLMQCDHCCAAILSRDDDSTMLRKLASFGLGAASGCLLADHPAVRRDRQK
jgi:hypothetical protein